MKDRASLRFALPPSLGAVRAGDLADRLARYLERASELDVVVYVASDYSAIEDDLIFGNASAAWSPPLLCQRVREAGGRFLLHAVRGGSERYRSALVRRKGTDVDVDTLSSARAAWVDPESTGGYRLVRVWLSNRLPSLEGAFASERFTGSYEAALRAVRDGDADVTAVFARPEGVEPHSALDEVVLEGKEGLELFAFTHEERNDGVIVAPDCEDEVQVALCQALAEPDEEGREVLAEVFHVEALSPGSD